MYEQANGDAHCFGTEHDQEDNFHPSILFGEVSQPDDQQHHTAMDFENQQQQPNNNWILPQEQQEIDNANNNSSNFLNLLNLPRCSTGHFQSALGYLGVDLHSTLDHNVLPASKAGDSYDSPLSMTCDPLLFHFNLPPQQPPPLFRDLVFQSPLFGDSGIGMKVDDDGDLRQSIRQEGEVLEFSKDPLEALMSRGVKEPKGPKNFVSERQRRMTMKDKYKHLRELVPNPSKDDRASIVAAAIEYINELNRTVNELKILVEKKRYVKQRCKRYKTSVNNDDGAAANGDIESGNTTNAVKPESLIDESFDNNGSLRSSWLQRKYKDTEIDVRIIDDEVTIKLVQRKKIINCLVYVSRTLDELQLDLRHVAGGHVGDYYSFLFNSKISEGSIIYAGAIANKLIEVLDREYNTVPSTSCY